MCWVYRLEAVCVAQNRVNSIKFHIIDFINSISFTLSRFAEAVRLHGSRLTDYERQEIDKYPEIWFLGLDSYKINAKPGTALNSGYDDDNGSYNKVNIKLN